MRRLLRASLLTACWCGGCDGYAANTTAKLAVARGEGKAWTLSSGAWRITGKKLSKTNECDDGRGNTVHGPECAYKLDASLATCLAHVFRGMSVTELGGGLGRYKRHVEGSGLTRAYRCYDGISNVAELSGGRVQFADLSVDSPTLVRSDFALMLEVGEHVPKRFEDTLMRNVDRANRFGIVLSWSNIGKGRSQRGHVNPKRKALVRSLLGSHGYREDRNSSSYLSKYATFLYLKRGMQVFRRNSTLTA